MAKIIIIAAIIYALSPVDLIPDFIPVLGYLDDLIILPILIYLSIKIIPKNILQECKAEGSRLLSQKLKFGESLEAKEIIIDGQHKKWYYGIPIIIIWIIIGIVILQNILKGLL